MPVGPFTMSHFHSINGQLDAADRYQAYLERAHEARMAKKREEIRQNSSGTFNPFINPDRDPRENPNKDEGQGEEKEPQEKEAQEETETGDGFGNHYA